MLTWFPTRSLIYRPYMHATEKNIVMFYAYLVPNPKLDIQTTHAAEKNIVMFYAYLVPNPKLDIQTTHAAEKNSYVLCS